MNNKLLESAPPFSFLLDGTASGDLLKDWERTSEGCVGEDGKTTTTERYRNPSNGLECRLEQTACPGRRQMDKAQMRRSS